MDGIILQAILSSGVAMDGIMLQAILSSGGGYGWDNTASYTI